MNEIISKERRRYKTPLESSIEILRAAIKNDLSEKQRAYLTLYYRDGMTQSEIGELYGIRKSAVSRTINRAIRNLKRVMRYADKRFLALSFQGGGNGAYNTKKRAEKAAL